MIRLVAPIKPGESDNEVPDVRPLGLGECLRRLIHSAVIAEHRDALAEHFWPQQVAVGVPGGLSLLVCGVRLLLELRPDFICVKLDLRNAYNEVKRNRVIRAFEAAPALRGLAGLFRATHAAPTKIYLSADGMPEADFRSEEGVHQGDALASAGFCIALHDEIRALDEELSTSGGAARFDMDDGYAIGPATAVFGAVARFAAAAAELGLELREDKSRCFSFGVDLRACAERPMHMPVGQTMAADGRVGYGIPVAGVPVGDA
eukprot:11089619-Karenia_brevis.AAC.1